MKIESNKLRPSAAMLSEFYYGSFLGFSERLSIVYTEAPIGVRDKEGVNRTRMTLTGATAGKKYADVNRALR
jgi:hypothetical protein